MPSSNVRDDLPAHYQRVRRLREIAAAVIRSLPRPIRAADGNYENEPAVDARTAKAPHALPGSTYQPYEAADVSEQQIRELLRRNRHRRPHS